MSRPGGLVPSSLTLENHKAIEVLSNTGPNPLKYHKTIKQAFNVGPQ